MKDERQLQMLLRQLGARQAPGAGLPEEFADGVMSRISERDASCSPVLLAAAVAMMIGMAALMVHAVAEAHVHHPAPPPLMKGTGGELFVAP